MIELLAPVMLAALVVTTPSRRPQARARPRARRLGGGRHQYRGLLAPLLVTVIARRHRRACARLFRS